MRLLTIEQKEEDDSQHVHALAEDVLHHRAGNECFGPAVGFARQQVGRWKLSGEGQRGQSVHDQVHPQHLNSLHMKVIAWLRHEDWV